MTIPFSLLLIKPMSIGRRQGPFILSDILSHNPVSLRLFRKITMCDTTLHALSQNPDGLKYDDEYIHVGRRAASWVCLFTHIDRQTDPTDLLNDYCGPQDYHQWLPHHLRYRYSTGAMIHPSDTIVYLSSPARVDLEANLLLTNFSKDDL